MIAMIIQGSDSYTSPSFSNENRMMRLLWNIVWFFLFRPTPRAMHAWRKLLLICFGAKLGKHVHIHGSTKIWAPWNLRIGNYVGIGEHVNIYCMDSINIGNYSVVSQGSHLCAGSHDFNTPNLQLITAPIVIGSRVWICAESFIGPGVSIAEGSVVGARSVVTKSIIDPWLVWAGVPARQVGVRDKKRVLQ
jgi:putative colanic acid biosynthesis acetyltransferase WcaF